MKTKVVVSVAIELAHPDGTKLRKGTVARYLKALLEGPPSERRLESFDMVTNKVVVRAVDLD